MEEALRVACDVCGQQSDIVKNSHVDAAGKRVEWPKVSVKAGRMYFTIRCPQCGEREQCVAQANDES
jgi:hypothetical protein